MACGSPDVYCPAGSAKPLYVGVGNYSTEADAVLDAVALSNADVLGFSSEISGTNLTSPAAIFTASWGRTTHLHVSDVTSGVLWPGQLIYGRGITDGTVIVNAMETARVTASTFGNETVDILGVISGSISVGDAIFGTGIAEGTRVVSLETGGGYSEYTGRVDINNTGRIVLSHSVFSSQMGITLRTQNTGVGVYTISQVQNDNGVEVLLKSADMTIKRAVPHEKIHQETRSSQQTCPLGNFCRDGMRNQCPVGTFGNVTGLSRCVNTCLHTYPCTRFVLSYHCLNTYPFALHSSLCTQCKLFWTLRRGLLLPSGISLSPSNSLRRCVGVLS